MYYSNKGMDSGMNICLSRSLSKAVLTHSLPGLAPASAFGWSIHPVSVLLLNFSD